MTQTVPGTAPNMSAYKPCYLVCMGDANDPDTWSSTPYHCLECGKAFGLFDGSIALHPHQRKFRIQRLVWNGWNVLRGVGRGGFQYSPSFLEALWKPLRETIRGATIVNMYQLYPDSVVADPSICKMFYVDGTLRQLADYYRVPVSARTTNKVIVRERCGYQSAEAIFTMSQFAAQSVINDYGIDPAKVHAIPPGANFSSELYHDWAADRLKNRPLAIGAGPLKMVIIAKDWKRKGVDRLIRAIQIGRLQGLQATLRVIGCNVAELPPELQKVPGVEWYGYLARRGQERRFLDIVAECNVGCLLSLAEFSSIALREYLALGMPVIGPRTGGCLDLMDPDSSIAVSPETSDAEIAAMLLDLERNPKKFQSMQEAAWRNRQNALWSDVVRKIQTILAAKP